jgi:hypothetical protein
MSLHRALLLSLVLAAPATASEPRPASVLVYPAVHSDAFRLTCISVTNTSPTKSVNAIFRYVSSDEARFDPDASRDCRELWRLEQMTPLDTVTVLTACHAAGFVEDHGYLVVYAGSPFAGGAMAHDALVGQAIFIDFNIGFGGVWSYLPAPLQAVPPDGSLTDQDFDGRLDFDGIEYEQLPDELYIDSFLGQGFSKLALLDLSGIKNARIDVQLFIWNDNEKATSATLSFRCWFEEQLTDLSPAFSETFLALNQPNDPGEVDLDCDGLADMEAGWARVSGSAASNGFSTVPNPALLGALMGGMNRFEGGRLLWGSNARSNGEL